MDEQSQTAQLYHADLPPRILALDEELTLPEVLGQFRVTVRRLFE